MVGNLLVERLMGAHVYQVTLLHSQMEVVNLATRMQAMKHLQLAAYVVPITVLHHWAVQCQSLRCITGLYSANHWLSWQQ
jgi:hypothetical protein